MRRWFREAARRASVRAGGLVLLCLAAASGVRAQVVEGPIRGFNLPIVDKRTFKVTARIRGEVAQPRSKDLFDLTGLRLETFSADARTNLVILARQCLLHTALRQISAPTELEVWGGEGQLALKGIGFAWEEAAGLVISNQVTAELQLPPAGAAPGGVQRSMRIRSERFTYREGEAAFESDVQAEDAQGSLTCDRLAFRLALGEAGVPAVAAGGDLKSRVERIEAWGEVRVRSGAIEATGDAAAYALVEDVVELTGQARWRLGARAGSAERIRLERGARRLVAEGEVSVKLPTGSLLAGGWLPAGSATPPPTGELEVSSSRLVLEPTAGRTNMTTARFEDPVRVVDGRGELGCRELKVDFLELPESPAVEAERGGGQVLGAYAAGEVSLVQDSNRVDCVAAEFSGTSAQVHLVGPVRWSLGLQRGAAKTVSMDLRRRRILAREEVILSLPAGSFGPAARLSGMKGRGGAADSERPPVEVTCGEFEYVIASADDPLSTGMFRRAVRVTSGPGLELTAARMQFALVPATQRVREMVAEGDVTVRAAQDREVRTARGDRAEYQDQNERLTLSGRNGVDFDLVREGQASHARGETATYDGLRDILELESGAVLESGKARVEGERVRLDRSRAEVSAQGLWKITLPVSGGKAALLTPP